MNFRILWFVGLVIAMVIGQIIRCIDFNRNKFSWLWWIPIIPSVALAFGIPSGHLIELYIQILQYYNNKTIFEFFIAPISFLFLIVMTASIGYWILGLNEVERINEIRDLINRIPIIYACIFIIGTGIWAGIFNNYNNNIEHIQETITIREERQLISFCNIPVQEISGSISGSFVLGTGSVHGDISTSNELPYWYMNENGEGKYDSAIANNSKIIFFNDNQKSYILLD